MRVFGKALLAAAVVLLPADMTQAAGVDDANAAVLTAGKTLKMSNSPWAHRGEPQEIDLLQSDDTRDELVSFLDHVRRRDRATLRTDDPVR